MSVRYLLPCPCGESVAVSASQAGGRVNCVCGASLEAPRLGELRRLEPAPDSVEPPGGWSFRMGVLSAGILAAAMLATVAGWVAATEPSPPPAYNPAARLAQVERGLDDLSPAELWRIYNEIYQPLLRRGFEVEVSPRDAAIEAAIAQARWRRNALLVAAVGVVAAAGLVAAVAPK